MGSGKKIVEILWTGGWDSTFRMVELSRMDVRVKPIYLHGDNRLSEVYERRAMDDILKALRRREETIAEILDVEDVNIADIPANKEITDAYNVLHKDTGLGSQHEYLARFAAIHPGIELGHELGVSQEGHLTKALNKWCHMEPNPEGSGYIFVKEKSTREGNLVLGNFTYSIMDKTEKDMAELIKEWGYDDIMCMTWFCHSPINGSPCGVCHPCQVKLGSGMDFLLPYSAVRRNRKFKKYKKYFGEEIAKRLARLNKED